MRDRLSELARFLFIMAIMSVQGLAWGFRIFARVARPPRQH